MKRVWLGMAAGAALAASGAGAQDEGEDVSSNRVNQETAWSVYVEEDPSQCWIVSAPVDTVNTREGEEVEVNRGEILVFVSYWPDQNRTGEISFTGGYPFARDSTVQVAIGSNNFELFTDADTNDEMAWAEDEAEDEAITAAMRSGAEMVLTARSSRGTTTVDTFSLMGFTAAIEDAEARCGG